MLMKLTPCETRKDNELKLTLHFSVLSAETGSKPFTFIHCQVIQLGEKNITQALVDSLIQWKLIWPIEAI